MLVAQAKQSVLSEPLHSSQRGSQGAHSFVDGEKYCEAQVGQLVVPAAVQVRQPVVHRGHVLVAESG